MSAIDRAEVAIAFGLVGPFWMGAFLLVGNNDPFAVVLLFFCTVAFCPVSILLALSTVRAKLQKKHKALTMLAAALNVIQILVVMVRVL